MRANDNTAYTARMHRMAALMLVVLLATGLPSRASQFHGPSPARCLAAVERTHGNVIRKVVLPCRDGDPWCDDDQQCDGKCTVRYCLVGQFFKGCPVFDVGFCPGDPAAFDTAVVPVGEEQQGEQLVTGPIGTTWSIRCLPSVADCNYTLPGNGE